MELIVALFYLSGLVKGFILFLEIPLPIDFTLLCVLLIPIVFIINYNRTSFRFSEENLTKKLLLLSFYLWMIFTWTYSPSETYKTEKSFLFLLNFIGFVTPFLIKNFNIKLFLRLIISCVLILTAMYLIIFYNYLDGKWSKEEFSILKSFYLQNGLFLGIQIIILFFAKTPIFKTKKFDYLLAFLCFTFLLFLGSRGPLFSVVIILLLASLGFLIYKIKKPIFRTSLKIKPLNVALTLLGLIVISVIIFLFQDFIIQLSNRSIIRIKLLLGMSDASVQDGFGSSVSTRLEQIELSVNYILSDFKAFFFGEGVGSFSYIETGEDKRSYPHNIFLEIMVELGLIGLILFLLFSYSITRDTGIKKYITPWIILYILLNISKSNSIIDLRIFFILLAIYNLEANLLQKRIGSVKNNREEKN